MNASPPSYTSATEEATAMVAALTRQRSQSSELLLPHPKRSRRSVLPSPATTDSSDSEGSAVDSYARHSHGQRRHAALPTPDNSSDEEGDVSTATLSCLASTSPLKSRPGKVNLTAKAVARLRQSSTSDAASNVESTLSYPSETLPRDDLVSGLIGASVLAIESIWPSHGQTFDGSDASVLPLTLFVREVLRRSRTSCSTLQLALFYLHQSRHDIRSRVARVQMLRKEMAELQPDHTGSDAFRYPSPPLSPGPDAMSDRERLQSELIEAQRSPVLCGRRMFLAALMSASKYLQDRNYSNRAWAKISGLHINEVSRNERIFLHLVEFSLYVHPDEFARWTDRLSSLLGQGQSMERSAGLSAVTPPRTLGRTASELVSNESMLSNNVEISSTEPRSRPRQAVRSQSVMESDMGRVVKMLPLRQSSMPATLSMHGALGPSPLSASSMSMSMCETPALSSGGLKFGLDALKVCQQVVQHSTSQRTLVSSKRMATADSWVVESSIVVD